MRHRASCRSRTSASPSRTARRTRSSSSRASTPPRRSPARRSRSSTLDGQRVWTGTTGADGIAIAPQTPAARSARVVPSSAFIVTAEKDGDVAYVGSDWNEGIVPWDFGLNLDLERGGAAAARHGLHRSRRLQARRGGALQGDPAQQHAGRHAAAAPPARRSSSSVRDSRNKVVDERTRHGERVEQRRVDAHRAGRGRARQLLDPRDARERPAEAAGAGARRRGGARGATDYREYKKMVTGSFLVAAYRRPDFRVDVTLTGDSTIAGDPLKGVVTAPVSLRRADGQAPDALDVHADAGLRRARGDHREVPGRALDVRRLVPTTSAVRARPTWARTTAR